ncbi:GNAT family N-acetyltransferase [Streptomyces sp. NBC_01481]|uniref:GNAT family N-acetyltransferase n=1 Tax=Streptomyces sp. NBC_01481 TaxID=2975869 RepID=UPI0022594605|nr:GNAT family N-acetyltransferase [Streptomyces sp. NBC_01481]MCX4584657.1 GNAT family N-acetyltransferase [Streptomyces sp. NBC_01481]
MTSLVQPSVAEQSEAEALFRFETEASETVRTALGMSAARIGGAVVLSMREDTTHFWSKALGFGVTTPVTAELISEVCDFYRAERTPRAVFQIAPAFLPEEWPEICEREGIVPDSSWVKLVCPTDEAVARADALEVSPDNISVAPLETGRAPEWGRVMMRAFGMPVEQYGEMGAATATRPGWHPFAAWLDGEIVGTGTLYVRGETAQMFAGAVLPHARNRGGQTALLAARARVAQELRCRLLIAETGVEAPGTHNSSLHNMLRLGFQVAYERRNWSWRLTPDER